ncbi:MAG: MAPEG family protein [SAR324 cluster bacterium]|nr:MAPEG family protein [SAR324 cluster bacterium]
MWVPYILDRFMVRGIMDTVGYPDSPPPDAPWAQRMQKAHVNAVENLVVFAPLVVVAEVVGASNELTATTALVYLGARVVHFVAYTAKIPWVRTLSFVVGVVGQVMLGLQILM